MESRGCAKPTIDAPRNFPLAPLDFEYLVLPQVYTFFRWRLYVCACVCACGSTSGLSRMVWEKFIVAVYQLSLPDPIL